MTPVPRLPLTAHVTLGELRCSVDDNTVSSKVWTVRQHHASSASSSKPSTSLIDFRDSQLYARYFRCDGTGSHATSPRSRSPSTRSSQSSHCHSTSHAPSQMEAFLDRMSSPRGAAMSPRRHIEGVDPRRIARVEKHEEFLNSPRGRRLLLERLQQRMLQTGQLADRARPTVAV